MADPMQTVIEVLANAVLHGYSRPADWNEGLHPRVKAFAAALLGEIAPLIRAEEREACAKVVEAEAHEECDVAEQIAAAIRQRGNE